MSAKARWRAAFLTLTTAAIVMEIVGAADGNPDTEPWTDLIVTYVPGEVAAVGFGALLLWLPIHFGIRYYRRARAKRGQTR